MPTLFSKGSGFLKPTYSVPTQETMPRPLGRCPGGGVSVSSLSFSTACKAQSHGVLLDGTADDPSVAKHTAKQ